MYLSKLRFLKKLLQQNETGATAEKKLVCQRVLGRPLIINIEKIY